MSRCDVNVVSFRVLCATLVATAVTFTVILTNVFVDFNLFLTKNHEVSQSPLTEFASKYEAIEGSEVEYNDEDKHDYNDIDPFYRTKRSIEPENVHNKEPNFKKMITNRLASLLKELDKEDNVEDNKPDIRTERTSEGADRRKNVNKMRNEDLFHLATHNILLQGMIGHMDLNDVYKKVHTLVNDFNNVSENNEDKKSKTLDALINSKEITETRKFNTYNDEHKFFEELLKCKKLKSQIANNELLDIGNNAKDNKMLIKAVIEIKEDKGNNNKMNLTNSTDNVEGLVKLIYNGKPIRVNQMKEKAQNNSNNNTDQKIQSTTIINEKLESQSKSANNNFKDNQKLLLNNLIEEYMKTHLPNYDFESETEIKNVKTERLKRQIKIRYLDEKTENDPKLQESVKDDNDIYIEIETHYDGKGIKGEKKKKAVKNLIEKIQKALHSDIQENNDIEHIKFIKRNQDPLSGNKHLLINKIPPPHDRIEQRQVGPIDKTLITHEDVLSTIDDAWKNQIVSPKFLSGSKSVNSAEMRQLNIEYDTVLKNGIPKRLQKPINTDVEDEDDNTTASRTENDPNNVTLFLKDIDGTGFSIGINRYVGEAPDKDSMKMFHGIENLIKEYHQNYDQDISNESDINRDNNIIELNNEGNQINDEKTHTIQTRSVNKSNNNDYNIKIFFKNNSLPSNEYVIKIKHSNESLLEPKNVTIKNLDLLNNSNDNKFSNFEIIKMPEIINKHPKPSDTLTIISPINRSKRSIIVKKISNIKSKIKMSRYINTNSMSGKKIFLKNKRNKRQINGIRIIARDQKDLDKNSDEIFMISKENTYPDKIKMFVTPETVIDVKDRDHYDEIYTSDDIYNPNQVPLVYTDLYNTRSGSNILTSRYPHIFINDDSRSKEDHLATDNLHAINENTYRIQRKSSNIKQELVTSTKPAVNPERNIPKVEEIINAIMPAASRTNYKLTLKITPKNISKIKTGFKEVHTSVNKSFDENGIRYFTLFNVSQISKIEKLNKTVNLKQEKKTPIIVPIHNELKEQQTQIKTLLQLHKKRVDQQLGNLLKERKHLEKMIEINGKRNINKTVNILNDDITPDDANDDKINKILASIKNLQENYNSIKNDIKNEAKIATERPKADNIETVQAIKSNEKITKELLKKIDTNTNILKVFLQKFTDNLKIEKAQRFKTTEKSVEIKLDTKEWNKNIYNSPTENTNNTMSYPYQQNKSPSANMMYQGQILTNTVQNYHENSLPNQPKISENSPINRRKYNETKFFMDEFDNVFKLTPNKPLVEANIKINTTNI